MPVVPWVPSPKEPENDLDTTIVNKTIIYSDTVLSLKDLGDNITVSHIENVSEWGLEDCLRTIFQSNPDVLFNTVQYSKENRTVYFYTDREITTADYEDRKLRKYKPITSSAEILEEAKNVLLAEKNKDSHCISLYDVAELLKELRSEYDEIKKRYKERLENVVNVRLGSIDSILVGDFDYEKRVLKIEVQGLSSPYQSTYFAKKDEDLYVTESECYWTEEIFEILGSRLSRLYDEFLKFSDYMNSDKSKYNVHPVNSSFMATITCSGVRISVPSPNNSIFEDEFELSSPSYANKYTLKCNSLLVEDTFRGEEAEILKSIFVDIDDCPDWSQAMLCEIRQNQLEEDQRAEEERKQQALKRQKRLEVVHKIFPFFKKTKKS